jgi:hypothetical protein
MNFLTYHNHGDLGFADAINRIDVLTRLSNKFGLTFAMPDLSTGIHNNNYLIEFGLHQYKFHHNSLSVIQIIEIDLDVFVKGFDFNSFDKCLFIIKNFDYGLAGKIARTIVDFPSFPFKQFFNRTSELENSLDVVIHLRMGDRYIYLINGRFVCPWKYIYSENDINIVNEFNVQWNFERLKTIINHYESNGIKYKIFSDGIGSAVKTLKTYHGWSVVDPIEIDRIISSILKFENNFLNEFSEYNLNYADVNISDLADAITHSKKILVTQGGLASSLNKFYNEGRASVQSFNNFYDSISN